MKFRVGFISNSSSTSFIVSKDRKNEALKYGLELISVSDIKAALKTINDAGGSFLVEYVWLLNHIKNIPDGDFITKPFDRDVAIERGIADNFPVFEGDL
jgi:hypothetical protein